MFFVCLRTDADRSSLATGWPNGVDNHALLVKRHWNCFIARCVNKYVHVVPRLSEHLRAVYELKRSTEWVFENNDCYFFHCVGQTDLVLESVNVDCGIWEIYRELSIKILSIKKDLKCVIRL